MKAKFTLYVVQNYVIMAKNEKLKNWCTEKGYEVNFIHLLYVATEERSNHSFFLIEKNKNSAFQL